MGRIGASWSRIVGALLRALGLSAVVIILLTLLFIFVPHLSIRQINAPLSSRSNPSEVLTGFSEEVRLGTFKQIVPNDAGLNHPWPFIPHADGRDFVDFDVLEQRDRRRRWQRAAIWSAARA